jgi:hypothetical protein
MCYSGAERASCSEAAINLKATLSGHVNNSCKETFLANTFRRSIQLSPPIMAIRLAETPAIRCLPMHSTMLMEPGIKTIQVTSFTKVPRPYSLRLKPNFETLGNFTIFHMIRGDEMFNF